MKALTSRLAARQLQGFDARVLNNGEVELIVIPELGAKIVSLKNLRTGREWLWHPGQYLKLFRNQPGDDFSASPLAGMDECLPTISPCSWRGRELPDHGEVWGRSWQVDADAWKNGILSTTIELAASPFVLQRAIELNGNEVRIGYKLTNLGAAEESFIWAIHPLLRLIPGDELELPESTRQLLNGEAWVDAVATAIPRENCAKVFACPLSEGQAAVKNENQRDRLEFIWDPDENNSLGLWLSRGGWHGHHHFAIEPTNANDDSLAIAAKRRLCGTVAGHSSVNWQFSLRVGF